MNLALVIVAVLYRGHLSSVLDSFLLFLFRAVFVLFGVTVD